MHELFSKKSTFHFLLSCFSLLLVQSPAFGDEFLYVVRASQLAPACSFQSKNSNELDQPVQKVVRGTVLFATEFRAKTDESPPLWKVVSFDGSTSEELFIQANHVILYHDNLDLLQKYDNQISTKASDKEPVPPLQVFSSGNRLIIQAWNDANKAIVATEELPESQRSPAPYFARAAVLNRVMSYSEALADCHRGNEILSRQNGDPVEIQRFSDIYLDALHGLQTTPVSQIDAESPIDSVVAVLINKVVALIRKNNFSRAETILNRVISLRPAKPKYWYLRAICRFLEGNPQLASSDAMIGQYFERRLPKNQQHDISRGLEHIQGPARLWLQSYRNGSAELVRMSKSDLR